MIKMTVTEIKRKVDKDLEEDSYFTETQLLKVKAPDVAAGISCVKKLWPDKPLMVIDGGLINCSLGLCVDRTGDGKLTPANDDDIALGQAGKLQLWQAELFIRFSEDVPIPRNELLKAVEESF